MPRTSPIALLCLLFSCAAAQAGTRFAIDPVPGSPTLGELLDRAEKPSAPIKASKIKPEPPKKPPLPVVVPDRDSMAPLARPFARANASAPYDAPMDIGATGALNPVVPQPVPVHQAPPLPAPLRIEPVSTEPLAPRDFQLRKLASSRAGAVFAQPEAEALVPLPEAKPLPGLAKPQPPLAPPLAVKSAAAESKLPFLAITPASVPAEGGEAPLSVPAKLPSAFAGQPASVPALAPGEGERFVYVVDQDLRAFLSDFARRVGLRPDIAPGVRGRLAKMKLSAEPTALLRELEKRYEIEWLIEGELLKVYARAELATRILPLPRITYEDLLRELKQVNIDTARYPLQKMAGSNAVLITAPVAHVARIAALIDTLKAGKNNNGDMWVIKAGVSHKITWE